MPFGACPLVLEKKNCAERPVFAQVVGELWAADPSKYPRLYVANAMLIGKAHFLPIPALDKSRPPRINPPWVFPWLVPRGRFARGRHRAILAHWDDICQNQESPRQTKPKKGPKRKLHEFRPFLWILVFFLRKTSTIHIELLFGNALGKSSWTDLSLVWFVPECPDTFLTLSDTFEHSGAQGEKGPRDTPWPICFWN